jgi:L-malate glycosyltransferase
MKLLLLADPESIHTIRWIKSLAKKNIEIVIFTFTNYSIDTFENYDNVRIISSHIHRDKIYKIGNGAIQKIKYLKVLPKLKRIIKKFKPNIVHAHYASSYGLLGALSGFHPFILSVWGADIFDFPKLSFLHKKIIQYNFRKADKILSTSEVMAKETKNYTNKKIEVTPFGINTNLFKPEEVNSLFSKNDIVIGTIKTLEPKYGIDLLIKSFHIVKNKYPTLPLKLLIVGEGSQDKILKQLVEDLNLTKDTIFTGYISHEHVPKYINMLSIYVSLSVLNSESFGVAIIEASACGIPVVVSNVGGLPEVVEDGKTGIVVVAKDEESAANAIEKLILDDKLKKEMGNFGRERVKRLYNWEDNVEQMMRIYQSFLN